MTIRLILLALFSLSPSVAIADDWPQFRGPGGSSSTETISLPVSWSVETGENISWSAELPGNGVSSPIVVGGKVIVTAASGADNNRLHVLAFDSMTGQPLWQRQFWATGRTLCYRTSSVAAPTPVSDGQRVFAFYSSNDLVCLDLDGNLQWIRELTSDHAGLGNDIGMASSPVVDQLSVEKGVVIVQCECQRSAFAAAYDTKSGKTVWEMPRDKESNWASPLIVPYRGAMASRTGVLLQGRNGLAMLSTATGEPLWEEPLEGASISSSADYEGMVLSPAGGLSALRRTAEGMDVVWQASGVKPGSPSPVAYAAQSRVFIIGRGGILQAVNLQNGEKLFKKRLGGTFWATPLLAAGKLYCINEAGKAFVLDADGNGEKLAECDFGTSIYGSPAAADGGMFVRSNGTLWKIATIDQAAREAQGAVR